MKLRKMAVTLAAGAVLAGGAVPALAADTTDATVTGAASLSIGNPLVGDVSVTLDGTAKTAHPTFENFDATDARGTGDGWNVTVQATQFAEHDGTAYVTGGKTLALNSLKLGVPTVAKKDSTSSDVPSISIASATAIDASGAVKIASATGPAGMGSYTFTQGDSDANVTGTQPLQLTVPASAYAKKYRSNVTVSIVTGP